jgi:hypothetical protein
MNLVEVQSDAMHQLLLHLAWQRWNDQNSMEKMTRLGHLFGRNKGHGAYFGIQLNFV